MSALIGFNTIYGADGEHRTPYLTRIWIGRLRLHIFHRGDADPDCHDHPWDFWTFPLTSYVEEVADPLLVLRVQGNEGSFRSDFFYGPSRRLVRAFRLHHRPAIHCHRVLGRYVDDGPAGMASSPWFDDRRVVTLVWQGRARRKWGFLRNRDGAWCWTPWKRYVFEGGKHAPCGDDEARP